MKNTLHTADCYATLQTFPAASIDLIYLDPPFNTGRNFGAFTDTWRVAADTTLVGKTAVIVDAARQLHSDAMGNYLAYMAERLLLMHRVLKPTGSLYFHCDPTASHYIKALLDGVFGHGNFRNEIVWCYWGPSNTRRWFPRKHDSILFYAKSQESVFNRDAVRVPYKILVGTPGGKFFGGRHNQARLDELRKIGKVVEDWWPDIFPVVNQSEKLGYPTQKPLALLERIIKASSNPGDVILDPFCGSGTACAVAQQLGRAYIGIDLNPDAIAIAKKRCADILNEQNRVSRV